jgi:hypothetical protein
MNRLVLLMSRLGRNKKLLELGLNRCFGQTSATRAGQALVLTLGNSGPSIARNLIQGHGKEVLDPRLDSRRPVTRSGALT